MSANALDWLIVFLATGALVIVWLAVATALDWFDDRDRKHQARQWDAHVHQAIRQSRDRHPSRYDVDCLDPSCVLCQRVHRG